MNRPPTAADFYDFGLRVVEARYRRAGEEGVRDLMLHPPDRLADLAAEIDAR